MQGVISNMTRGEFIATRLKEMKKSKTELARALNVSNTSVTHWVKGNNFIEHVKIKALCDFLGCSIEEIYKYE